MSIAVETSTGHWRYQPPPAPDGTDGSCGGASTGGWRAVAARARGRKHKHDGTHCDDWFEVRAVGRWLVAAVADGAGSRPFSRHGARVACEGAIRWLEGSLDEAAFLRVEHALKGAMVAGWESLHGEVRRLAEVVPDRRWTLDDLSTTLLLVVVSTAPEPGDAVHAACCAAGDGMVAALVREEDGTVATVPLMVPEQGEFAGEVRFLAQRTVAPAVTILGRPPLALVAMSDGVADDYFPTDDGVPHLLGDLVLNGIVDHRALGKGRWLERVPFDLFSIPGERSHAHGVDALALASFERLCRKLEVTPRQAVSDVSHLWRGVRGRKFPADTPEQRLQIWLDSYRVKGSFDDRTLVAMHPEVSP